MAVDEFGPRREIPKLVEQRNDLATEIAALYNNLAQPEVALALLESHQHGASTQSAAAWM